MHKMPSLDAGTVVDWQILHRSVRLAFAEQLVGRTIQFHTYFSKDTNASPTTVKVLEVAPYRQRSKGFDRAFVVHDDLRTSPYWIPWNRIVEVIVC